MDSLTRKWTRYRKQTATRRKCDALMAEATPRRRSMTAEEFRTAILRDQARRGCTCQQSQT